MNTLLAVTSPIQVGQVVSTSLYNRGGGVVVAIHGAQALVQQTGAIARVRGASFDIIFSDGQRSNALPECILRGVQWRVFDEVVSMEEVRNLGFAAEAYAAEQAYREAQRAAAFATAVAGLKVNPEYAHLEQASAGAGDSKLAVRNVRKSLKKAFPGVKFSVRSDYSSVNVRWVDGPTAKAVDAVISRFDAGHFDGMADCYEYTRVPFTEVFGSIRYTFTSRTESDDLIGHAIAEAFRQYGDDLVSVPMPTADDYRTGALWRVPVAVGAICADDLQALVRRIAHYTTCAEGQISTDMTSV